MPVIDLAANKAGPLACGMPPSISPVPRPPFAGKLANSRFRATDRAHRPAMVGKWRRNRSSGSVSTIGIGSSLSFAGNLRLRDDRRCSSTVDKRKPVAWQRWPWPGCSPPTGSTPAHGKDCTNAQLMNAHAQKAMFERLEVGSTSTSSVIGFVLARALRSTLQAAAFRKR